MNPFFARFGRAPVLLPVIGFEDMERAQSNAETAYECRCPGIFLVNNAGITRAAMTLAVHWLRQGFPREWFVGVNFLMPSRRSFDHLTAEVDGLWTDDAGVDERQHEQGEAEAVAEARAPERLDGACTSAGWPSSTGARWPTWRRRARARGGVDGRL